MIVDCDRCAVRGPGACGDCVVTVLLGTPPGGVELDASEQRALEALAGAGMVPPLRLVTGAPEAGSPPRGDVGNTTPRQRARRAAGFD